MIFPKYGACKYGFLKKQRQTEMCGMSIPFLFSYWYLWYLSYIQFVRMQKLIHQENDIMLFILDINLGN